MEGVRFIPGGTEGELIMDGALTIENAAEIRNVVRDALAGADSLVLTIGENADVDITFLQILCSAHRTAVKGGRQLFLKAAHENGLSRMLSEAGFTGSNCDGDRQESCLWARRGGDE